MIITVPDPQQRQMGEAKGSGRGGGCSEAEKTGWHHTQVGWHRLAQVGTILRFFIFTFPSCNGPGRSKREKEEETTRTVVVRRRHQSDSDDGTDHAVNQYSIYKSAIS